MKIKINDAKELSNAVLAKFGFTKEESNYITENLLEGELTDNKTHGFVRLVYIKKQIDKGNHNLKPLDELTVINQSPTFLHLDGKGKIGLGVIYKSLDLAFEKMKDTKLLAVGIKDVGLTGFIGAYARKAAENDLISIWFNRSPGGLVPFGSKQELWGTNPLTVGIPTDDVPVILDMASSQITWGDLLVAKNEGTSIKEGVAIDETGIVTIDPEKAMGGGLLPFSGHKGSGLAFIVELLGGALVGAGCGHSVEGGWGSFYILIDPTIFRPLDEFKKDVKTAITELKNAEKAPEFNEIYFAGEQSAAIRTTYLENGEFDISDKLYQDLQDILKG